jgi:alpha-1,2-glucosyltransferase
MLTPTLTFLGSTYSLISLPLFPRLKFKYFLIGIYCTAALGTTLIVIKYNTIIHPFTLADNRHYVFYIFRYSILRHPLIRYSLGPIYLICGYLAYLTLCPQLITPTPQSQTASQERKTPKEIIKERRERESRARVVKEQPEGPTTSFLLIFVLSTALSLITAPLVEPRYFIIPWVIWRLHVPPLPSSPTSSQTSASTGQGQKNANGGRWMEVLKSYLFQGHDYRLWLETACFLLIDLITGYIFLYRGFSWPQEPGKVQRFMW